MASIMSLFVCAVLAFGRVVAALNATSVSNCTASGNATTDYDFSHTNATGVLNFTVSRITGDLPWYYYVLLADNDGQQEVGRFLAMPESAMVNSTKNFTRLCAYALDGGFDSPKDGRGNQTCEGIVPEKCTERLFHGVDFGPGGDCFIQGLNDDCNSYGWHTSAIRLARGLSCLHTGIPGINLPSGYLATSLGTARTIHQADASHKAYDNFVQKSHPLVLEFVDYTDLGRYSYKVDFVDAQRLCVAPTELEDGSRVPPSPSSEPDKPKESEGLKLQASLLGLLAIVMFVFL